MTASDFYDEISSIKKQIIELQEINIESEQNVNNDIIFDWLEDANDSLRNCKDYLNEIIYKESMK